MPEFKEGFAARRALLKYDWEDIAERLLQGGVKDGRLDQIASSALNDLSWGYNAVFREFGRGHLVLTIDCALDAVECALPDYDYSLERRDGGWFFSIDNLVGSNYSLRSLAIYQALAALLARWRRLVESGQEKV